jgi:LysR family hca operon transcriptional activator
VLKRANQAIQRAALAAKVESSLTIGVVMAAEIKILPTLFQAMGQRAKNLSLEVRHLSSMEQIPELRNGSIDGGFLAGPIVDSEIDWMELLTEGIIVVVPGNHPVAKSKKISLEKLMGQGLSCIGRSGALSPALQNALAPFIEVAQKHITFTRDAPNVLGQMNMVKAGQGFAVFPDYARLMLPRGVIARPLDWDPPLSVALGFAWLRTNPSKALRLFRRVLAESAKEIRAGKPRAPAHLVSY